MRSSTYWSLTGVVEGANHPPFSHQDRKEFIRWLGLQGYNAYIYASKFDRLQNEDWSVPLTIAQHNKIIREVDKGNEYGVMYYYGLRPVNMHQDLDQAIELAYNKLEQLVRSGLRGITILFDDMSDTRVSRHVRFCNELADRLSELISDESLNVSMCPQAYHGDATDPTMSKYLAGLFDLRSWIDIFYTGLEIVPTSINCTETSLFYQQAGRQPLIWDNQFCDDLDLRPSFGPLTGRDPDLWTTSCGWFANTARHPDLMKRSLVYASQYLRDPYKYSHT